MPPLVHDVLPRRHRNTSYRQEYSFDCYTVLPTTDFRISSVVQEQHMNSVILNSMLSEKAPQQKVETLRSILCGEDRWVHDTEAAGRVGGQYIEFNEDGSGIVSSLTLRRQI